MADSSYVTVEVSPWAAPTLAALARRWGTFSVDDGGAEATFEDSSWGVNGDDVQQLLAWLQKHKIRYVAHDGGHYTWDPYLLVHDGDVVEERPAGQEGRILADAGNVERILAAADPAAEAAKFFDLWGWLRGDSGQVAA